jgi:hypothetical protein
MVIMKIPIFRVMNCCRLVTVVTVTEVPKDYTAFTEGQVVCFWGTRSSIMCTQCMWAIACRRFGKSYRSHLQGSAVQEKRLFPIAGNLWERGHMACFLV